MSASSLKQHFITPTEYLEGEEKSQIRYEYADGQVYAMSGASDRHNEIIFEFTSVLKAHLKGGPCRTYFESVKVELTTEGKTYFYYPDVFVTCAQEDHDSPLIKRHPALVIEVLSPSTWRIDQGEKLANYIRIPGISEVVLAAQEWPEIVLHRKANDWRPETFVDPDIPIPLQSIDLEITLRQIYGGISFARPSPRPWYLRDHPEG